MKPFAMRTYGDKVLRKKGEEVKEFSSDLPPLLNRMVDTMIVANGVGLAAPQVGVSRQIAIVNPEPSNEKTLIRMINPRIVWASRETESMDEGCLSVPGVRGDVERHTAIEVVYQDEAGAERRMRAEGFLARIIQHEIDHLNGVLFVDRLSFAKRALIKTKLRGLSRRERET